MISHERASDMLLGALVGVMATGLSSLWVVGQRVAALEVEVRVIRQNMETLLARPTGFSDGRNRITVTYRGHPR